MTMSQRHKSVQIGKNEIAIIMAADTTIIITIITITIEAAITIEARITIEAMINIEATITIVAVHQTVDSTAVSTVDQMANRKILININSSQIMVSNNKMPMEMPLLKIKIHRPIKMPEQILIRQMFKMN